MQSEERPCSIGHLSKKLMLGRIEHTNTHKQGTKKSRTTKQKSKERVYQGKGIYFQD